MSNTSGAPDFTRFGFIKSFVIPAIVVFLLPGFTFYFFKHVESTYNKNYSSAIISMVQADQQMKPEEKNQLIKFYESIPYSQLMKNEEFANQHDWQTRMDFWTFRWMIRLSVISILASVLVLIFVGICIILSLKSQQALYASLLISWQLLRINGALQTIIMGILTVALSYWLTAFFGNVYIPKLIFVVGFIALAAIFLVLVAIFKSPQNKFQIEGELLTRENAGPLWMRLENICEKVGTNPPDQVIAGIDDNFFVTETPVYIDENVYNGKTLFVSLPLLKQLNSTEADCILAHEMAHFSGQDTLYSKKIWPLILRFHQYLTALYQGGITFPVFYYINCFYMLYELSIQKSSRSREYRADAIAAETTSPQDYVRAMLRTAAYSSYRTHVETNLFKEQKPIEQANISGKIEDGFHQFALSFGANSDVGNSRSAHPFDSHPTMDERLSAVGIELDEDKIRTLLNSPVDGGWYHNISNSSHLEQQQWQVYEDRFRQAHEYDLSFRYLPANPEEQALVEKIFPEVKFESKKNTLTICYDKFLQSDWEDPVYFKEITNTNMDDNGKLTITFTRDKNQKRIIKTWDYKPQHENLLHQFQLYYSRHLTAIEYQKRLQAAST